MRAIGFTLMIIGGGWTGVWALEWLLIRNGIHQALGDFDTPYARAESDERGKRHQQRMIAFFRRGLVLSIPVTIAGVVLLVVAS